ncbi:hypothetical protein H6P81_010529 [Aristolochia fimbriata]|uniref:Uncharacterized protein n=1 Tax=Aristolochia fimbriata TaxID=158543 RepID=A0AAV7EQ80_ARIFI|nr:hypothetical protein H6P81_010529 [Aristolochia fimbriata]
MAVGNLAATRDMGKVKCHYCQEFGHMKFTCPKLRKLPLSTFASPTLTFSDIQEMINKALIGLGQGTSSASALSASSGKSSWIVDSGASNHMTFDSTIFMSTSSSSLSAIYTADGSTLSVSYSGSVCTSCGIHLSDVFHVPTLSMNMLFVGQLCDLGLDVVFSSVGCQVRDPSTGKVYGTGRKVGRLFELDTFDISDYVSSHCSLSVTSDSDFILWHSRLGHVSRSTLHKMISSGSLGSVSSASLQCISCKLGKHTALPFHTSEHRSLAPFDVIHSDIWGSAPVPTMGGSFYYVIFIDDYSRFICVYLLRACSEFYNAYVNFTTKLSYPYTPQQNGVAERKHRHIVETARTLMLSSSVQKQFWGFRCFDPVANKLRIPRHVTFWEHVPFYSLPKHSHQSSMSPTVAFDIFPDDASPLFSTFSDSVAGSLSDDTLSPSTPAVDVPVPSSASSSEPIPALAPDVPPLAPRQSSRIRQPSVRLNDYHCFFSALTSVYEPSSYREASSDPIWQQAMAEELQALDKAHTWDLVSLPPGKSPIGCKWVYKVKTKADGSIDRYKARRMAKGYNQEYGIDNEETFATVARLTSVHVFIAIASIRHWDFFQMDVKNAFLNGTLTEEVYMLAPLGSSHPLGKVCRLCLALYGLKQAPRAWFSTFCSKIVQFGYTQSSHDSALFTRQSSSGTVLLLLYVDDMVITGDDIHGISDLKRYLSSCFEMKDLDQLRYFLGLEVLPFDDGYGLSQVKYAFDLLNQAGLSNSKVCDSPMELNAKFRPANGELLSDPTLYRQLVGGLLYLIISRPDISYAVHVVSQFMSAPRSVHYAAVLRIMRYIKGSLFQGLVFGSSS